MAGTLKYYLYYFKNIFLLGTINIFLNRKKFKEFSVTVNDFKANYNLLEKSKYLKQVDLYDLLGENYTNKIKIENWKYKQGNVSLYELYCICSLSNYLNPANVFEIGTFDGNTTFHIAINTTDTTVINTLDLPPAELETTALKLDAGDAQLIDKKGFRIGQCFINTEASKKIKSNLSDSARFDFSGFHKNIDLFFVDGAHSYEYVEVDTKNAFNSVKDTGIILWHDYGNVLDVTEYLNDLSKSKPVFRIKHTSLAFYAPSLMAN